MNAIVDWLSFTIPSNTAGMAHSEDTNAHIQMLLSRAGCDPLLSLIGGESCTPRSGRGHYGAGYFFEQFHISIWFGGIANHVLVECAGVGCQALREIGALDMLIAHVKRRITRVDIAVDFETIAKPTEFVDGGYNERFKSRSSIISPDGETEYVGSPSSERFCRIYRYASPHPRAALLRVEFVTRGKWAKAAALSLMGSHVGTLASQLGNSFGFQHALWADAPSSVERLSYSRDEAGEAGSIFWLSRQVRPALLRLHKKGLINLREWVDNLLAELE